MSVGHVILGSVEGNRIWARDLRSTQLTHLEVSIIIRPLYSISQQSGVWYRSLGDFLCQWPVRQTLMLYYTLMSDVWDVLGASTAVKSK